MALKATAGRSVDGSYGIGRRLSAWGVHAFTASGVVLGLLALLAAVGGDAKACLGWLGLALVVDGVDGTLARRASVKEVLPGIDGSVLDLVIDYLTYVVVPAVFLYRFGLFPTGFGIPLAAWVLMTSLYCFSNTGMKSGDNYFVGFPAIWNVVALYLWILDLDPWINTAVVLVLGVLTFSTVKFLHPFRVRKMMHLNIAVSAAWLASSAALVVLHPDRPDVAWAVWLASGVYYVAVCAWRTLRGDARG
ncbi:phosphatidylcholine synthase [Azospirillum soli]|uniref:phosphatidylcholine synthase n=1 Tax=Azospirillum soli TaxID=1304799 RepID=UPI001FE2B982|nr:phosphatidylcholine/phosphatidylserine synthase [Azospirillum soli]MBP2312068.1 phosphatidylcholine synthase [Azospirillum soli]